jgi:hypothetical protein
MIAVLGLALALASPSPAPSPSSSPSPSPSPAASAPPRSIRDSIDPVVDRLEAERKDPCLKARREGVPCFPSQTETRGPTASVREGLGLPDRSDKKPSPDRPPTVEEMGPYRPTPTKPAVSVTIDPGCVGKSILKGLRGKNDTYYLYRLRDVNGERVVLYDHRIDPLRFQGEVEFLGKFDGECDALAAYERERRRSPSPAPPPP